MIVLISSLLADLDVVELDFLLSVDVVLTVVPDTLAGLNKKNIVNIDTSIYYDHVNNTSLVKHEENQAMKHCLNDYVMLKRQRIEATT